MQLGRTSNGPSGSGSSSGSGDKPKNDKAAPAPGTNPNPQPAPQGRGGPSIHVSGGDNVSESSVLDELFRHAGATIAAAGADEHARSCCGTYADCCHAHLFCSGVPLSRLMTFRRRCPRTRFRTLRTLNRRPVKLPARPVRLASTHTTWARLTARRRKRAPSRGRVARLARPRICCRSPRRRGSRPAADSMSPRRFNSSGCRRSWVRAAHSRE